MTKNASFVQQGEQKALPQPEKDHVLEAISRRRFMGGAVTAAVGSLVLRSPGLCADTGETAPQRAQGKVDGWPCRGGCTARTYRGPTLTLGMPPKVAWVTQPFTKKELHRYGKPTIRYVVASKELAFVVCGIDLHTPMAGIGFQDLIVAVNLSDGERRWWFFGAGRLRGSCLALDAPGTLYVACCSEAFAVDTRTGGPIWRAKLALVMRNSSSIILDESRVYIVLWGGGLLALSRKTGEIAWQRQLPVEEVRDRDWRATMSLMKGRLFVLGEGKPDVWAVSTKTGKISWHAKLPSARASGGRLVQYGPTGFGAVAGGQVIVPGWAGFAPASPYVCGMAQATGKVGWKFSFGQEGAAAMGVAVGGQRLYCGIGSGEVVSLDMKGKQVWRTKLTEETPGGARERAAASYVVPVVLCGDVLLAARKSAGLFGLRASDGKVLWRTPFQCPIHLDTRIVLADDRILLNCGNRLLALRTTKEKKH